MHQCTFLTKYWEENSESFLKTDAALTLLDSELKKQRHLKFMPRVWKLYGLTLGFVHYTVLLTLQALK